MTIFEKIILGEIPSFKIFEDEKFIVILDAFPKNLGHTLVIPKIANDNVLEENDQTISSLFFLSKKISNLLMKKLQTNDIKWVTNIGKNAGQEVFHTHIHLIPYYDKEKQEQSINKNELEKVLELIKN